MRHVPNPQSLRIVRKVGTTRTTVAPPLPPRPCHGRHRSPGQGVLPADQRHFLRLPGSRPKQRQRLLQLQKNYRKRHTIVLHCTTCGNKHRSRNCVSCDVFCGAQFASFPVSTRHARLHKITSLQDQGTSQRHFNGACVLACVTNVKIPKF